MNMFKKVSRILAISILLFLAFPFLIQPVQVSAWWDNDWDYRNVLSMKVSSLSGDLTNFPVTVFLDSTRIDFGKIDPNGADIRFVDGDDATPLSYEIDYWDDVAEEAVIHVKIPTITAGVDYSDYFYIYYGNSGVGDGQNAADVWSNGYTAVWHMNDDPDTSHIVDSLTVNDGTKLGANEPLEIVGDVGYAQQHDGINDYINVGNDASLSITTGEITVELYGYKHFEPDANPGALLSNIRNTGGYFGYEISNRTGTVGSQEWYAFEVRCDDATAKTIFTWINPVVYDGTQHYIVGNAQQNGANYDLELYYDTTLKASGSQAGTLQTTNNRDTYIGRDGFLAYYEQYDADEIRISSVVRTSDWMATTYSCLQDDFLYYGAEDPPPGVTTLIPTNVSMTGFNTTATIRGSLDDLGGSPTCSVVLEWGYTTTYGRIVINQSGVAAPQIFTATITQFDPEQTVHYRIQATNVDGTTYGADYSFGLIAPAWYSLIHTLLPVAVAAVILIGVLVVMGNPIAAFLSAMTGLVGYYVILALVSPNWV